MCEHTRKAADEPVELLFRDVGPREVECYRLSLYDACEGLRSDGTLDAQVNLCPKSLV